MSAKVYLIATISMAVISWPMSIAFFASGNVYGGLYMLIFAVTGTFGPIWYALTGEIPHANDPLVEPWK